MNNQRKLKHILDNYFSPKYLPKIVIIIQHRREAKRREEKRREKYSQALLVGI